MTWKRWVLVALAAALVFGGALIVVNLRVPPAPQGYASVTHNVVYYPACGNETLIYEGKTWYPISRDWATPTTQAFAASGGRGISASVPMVAPPGPGDDLGTLYVYQEGRAYWVSDNGSLDTWLTLVPQTYNWVC